MNFIPINNKEISYIHIHIHPLKIISHCVWKVNKYPNDVFGNYTNTLYDFEDYEKLLDDLSNIFDLKTLNKIKEYILDNCVQAKKINNKKPDEKTGQISLF